MPATVVRYDGDASTRRALASTQAAGVTSPVGLGVSSRKALDRPRLLRLVFVDLHEPKQSDPDEEQSQPTHDIEQDHGRIKSVFHLIPHFGMNLPGNASTATSSGTGPYVSQTVAVVAPLGAGRTISG